MRQKSQLDSVSVDLFTSWGLNICNESQNKQGILVCYHFQNSHLRIIATVFCSDPSKRVDFVIVHETDKLDAVDDHRSVHQRRRVFQVTFFRIAKNTYQPH
jgi:hypothetical protein